MKVSLEGGKYEVTYDLGIIRATRHGEPWRDLTGDKLVGALVDRIEELESAGHLALNVSRKFVKKVDSGLAKSVETYADLNCVIRALEPILK